MKVLFIERKPDNFPSILRVFRQLAKSMKKQTVLVDFQELSYSSTFWGICRNLVEFKPKFADIYHITGHTYFIALILPPNKTIMTVHDLRILRTVKGLRRYLIKKIFFDLPFRRIKYITVISEHTKNEILELTGCDENKLIHIPNPVIQNTQSYVKKEFNAICPTILQVGTLPHKNLSNLIKAIEGINCNLRIIGKLSEDLIRQLNASGVTYSNDFNLTDSEMQKEYVDADILAFCSLYEGFGLPVIEAAAVGTPVITSNLPPMSDIGFDFAVLVNPFDVSEIKSGILKIINDNNYRSLLIKKGINRSANFDSDAIAEKYVNLYSEVYKSNC